MFPRIKSPLWVILILLGADGKKDAKRNEIEEIRSGFFQSDHERLSIFGLNADLLCKNRPPFGSFRILNRIEQMRIDARKQGIEDIFPRFFKVIGGDGTTIGPQ